jgi:hypothetical protein
MLTFDRFQAESARTHPQTLSPRESVLVPASVALHRVE